MSNDFRRRRARASHISLYTCRIVSMGWNDPRWKRRKHEKFKSVRGRCETAGCPQRARIVHHKKYGALGKPPWDYDDDELEALCHDCHWRKHNPPPQSNPAQGVLFTQEELGPLFRRP